MPEVEFILTPYRMQSCSTRIYWSKSVTRTALQDTKNPSIFGGRVLTGGRHKKTWSESRPMHGPVISAALSYPRRQADDSRRSFAFSPQVKDASYDEEADYQQAVGVGDEAQIKPRDACGEQNGQRDQERVCSLVHVAIVRHGLRREIARYP
jgi:hypothetical protein